ncbi:oligopeptide ABC transporter substrate-binding protein OppA [Moraxella caviae]|uniref:Oligopeptide ABC transporter substrate-binding protein OppA n=1 Tax=Moraxella caviae TaxID=34060 RepID=A0A1T0A6I9_9GAMM|nr:ABC transporter substrate-binding protein [Moraxella caviae]OOR91198.1 oligopeptide ABC transporter substrate-binding protein OppA [Moraxella caviae]STZ13761.1 Periplasmic oligopeptide-binding protein precursor [Moraxella caviae]VEW12670.1 Periplasmic oligopeptide-binding protein precursor [Moraxella caviae]
MRHFKPTHLALALGVGALLTACGGNDGASQISIDPNTLADVQTVTINNGTEIESVDPHKVSGVPESNVIRQMLVGLTTTDSEGNTIGGMAESWESPDNKIWTFKLRDAKWSNGDAVTAHDFVYSMQRLVDPATASPYATYLETAMVSGAADIIAGKAAPSTLGVKALDDKTLEVTLSEPVPYFPDTLIHSSMKPVHKATVEAHGDKWTQAGNIVVNGAYTLAEWQVNSHIKLKRNEAYFANDKTTINEITILPSPAQTAIDRYKAGEVDFGYEIPPEQFEALKRDLGEQIKTGPRLCTYYYEFNTKKAPFDNPKVRKALSLALDRDTIVNQVLARGEEVAYQFTPTATQDNLPYTPEWKSWDKAKRIEEAKKLLGEAGFNESNPLKFELLYNTHEGHKKVAVAAAALWKEALGAVDVTLTNQEWKTYLDSRQNGNFEVARGGWCADYNESSSFLNIFISNNTQNYGKYANPAFDSIMKQTLTASTTPEARAKLYQDAEAQLDADAPNIFIYHYVGNFMVKPYILGFNNNDPMEHWQIKDWSIAKH